MGEYADWTIDNEIAFMELEHDLGEDDDALYTRFNRAKQMKLLAKKLKEHGYD